MKAMNDPVKGRPLGEWRGIRSLIVLSLTIVVALVYVIIRRHAGEDPKQTLLRSELVEGPAPTAPEPPPDYHLELQAPKPGPYRPKEEIQVRASMTLSEGQKPPSSAQVLIRKRGFNLNSAFLKAEKGDGPGSLTLEGKIKLPNEPGQVDVVITAVETKVYQREGREPEVRIRTVSSSPLKILVGK